MLHNRTIDIFQITQPRPNHSATWDESGQRPLTSLTISIPTEVHTRNLTKTQYGRLQTDGNPHGTGPETIQRDVTKNQPGINLNEENPLPHCHWIPNVPCKNHMP